MKGRTDSVNGKPVFPWNAMEVHLGSLKRPEVEVTYLGRKVVVSCPALCELVESCRTVLQQEYLDQAKREADGDRRVSEGSAQDWRKVRAHRPERGGLSQESQGVFTEEEVQRGIVDMVERGVLDYDARTESLRFSLQAEKSLLVHLDGRTANREGVQEALILVVRDFYLTLRAREILLRVAILETWTKGAVA